MPIKDAKELFIWMLSDLRQGAERSTKLFQELAQIAQDPDKLWMHGSSSPIRS